MTNDELLRQLKEARARIAELEALSGPPWIGALDGSPAPFRTLVENSPDVIMILDRTGVIRFINRTLPEYRVEDVIGTHAEQYLDGQDARRYREALERLFETSESSSIEVGAAGDTWWLSRLIPLPEDGRLDRVLAISSDITERKRAEEALRESEARFRTLADTTTAAIFIFQGEKMVYANSAAEAITGYDRDELARMNFWEVIHPDEREAVRARGMARQAGEAVERRSEVRLLTKSGDEKWVDYMGSVFALAGRPAVLGTAVDITERKRAEEERRLLEKKVQHAQKLESLGVLAGGIAHDFNNLLTGILGSASLAAMKTPPGSPASEQLERILKSAEKAAVLTNQMLAYSGRGQFVMGSVDLNATISEAATLLRGTLPKGAELKLLLAENLPPLFADRAQMQQIVMNLGTNAAEALDGEGEVLIRTGAIAPEAVASSSSEEALPEGPQIFLEVRDTGRGMDEETEQRIFDPFFTTKFTGRGLGLAAVQGIVRAHGGTIRVESVPQVGTSVRVLFPAATSRSDAIDFARAPAVGGRTVLVIDDEESVRTVARLSLEEGGFEVLTADSGQSAIALFEECGDRIDAVLLDMSMPQLSGEDTLEAIRERRPHLPVVVTSGYSEQEIVQRLKGSAFSLFVQKPFRAKELVLRVQEAVSSTPKR